MRVVCVVFCVQLLYCEQLFHHPSTVDQSPWFVTRILFAGDYSINPMSFWTQCLPFIHHDIPRNSLWLDFCACIKVVNIYKCDCSHEFDSVGTTVVSPVLSLNEALCFDAPLYVVSKDEWIVEFYSMRQCWIDRQNSIEYHYCAHIQQKDTTLRV